LRLYIFRGEFLITWNDDGSEKLVLKKHDTISIPPGVYRSFTNIGTEDGLAQVIISGSVNDMNNMSFTHFAASQMEKTEIKFVKKF